MACYDYGTKNYYGVISQHKYALGKHSKAQQILIK